MVGRLHRRRRRAHHQPQSPLPPVARRADRQRATGRSLTSVTAAYLQRNMRPQVRSITVHPPGIVFQKPYTTGEPDLAGFDDQTTPERKLAQAAMSAAAGRRSPSLGRRTYQKGLQTLSLAGRRRERRRTRLRRALPPRGRDRRGSRCASGVTDPILGLGHDDGARTARTSSRSSRRTRRRTRPARR